MEEFTKRLRLLRVANRYKQADISQLLDVHRTTYTKYETGRAQPPLETILSLCRLYHVSADFLLGLEGRAEDISLLYKQP